MRNNDKQLDWKVLIKVLPIKDNTNDRSYKKLLASYSIKLNLDNKTVMIKGGFIKRMSRMNVTYVQKL